MSVVQQQNITDINNIVYTLQNEYTEKIKDIAEKMLDINLLAVMPKLAVEELKELDITEKLMLLREFSLSEKERAREKEEAIPLAEILKEEGLE